MIQHDAEEGESCRLIVGAGTGYEKSETNPSGGKEFRAPDRLKPFTGLRNTGTLPTRGGEGGIWRDHEKIGLSGLVRCKWVQDCSPNRTGWAWSIAVRSGASARDLRRRVASYPDVPTVPELGIPIVRTNSVALAGPAGMSKDVVTILLDAFDKAHRSDEFQAALGKFLRQSRHPSGDELQVVLQEQCDGR